ncbi:hypothetical protein D9M70_630140 [compost metagenome]
MIAMRPPVHGNADICEPAKAACERLAGLGWRNGQNDRKSVSVDQRQQPIERPRRLGCVVVTQPEIHRPSRRFKAIELRSKALPMDFLGHFCVSRNSSKIERSRRAAAGNERSS